MHAVSQHLLLMAYHVITCIGTGTQRTTGVRASKLGFASIKSSPTVQNSMSSSTIQQGLSAEPLTSETHGCAQQDHGCYFESIEMVMMSHAGIEKSYNLITVQACGLEAISQWITVGACSTLPIVCKLCEVSVRIAWHGCVLTYSSFCGCCKSFATSRLDQGLFAELFTIRRRHTSLEFSVCA